MADATGIRQRLLERAFLYDDPDCYAAGVRDAIEEVSRTGAGAEAPESPGQPEQPGQPHEAASVRARRRAQRGHAARRSA